MTNLPQRVNFAIEVGAEDKLPVGVRQSNAMKFVDMLLSGYSNEKAYESLFPDRYIKYSSKNRREIRYRIREYMKSKYVQEYLTKYQKEYWTAYLDKKIEQLDWLHETAMNEEEPTRVRLEAVKLFQNIVVPPKEDLTISVKHKHTADEEFKAMLQRRQQALYDMANS